jgi:Ca2+-binding EF-hand superfamily protein
MSKKKVLIVAALLVAGGAAIAVSAPGQRLQDRMMDRWSHGGGPGMGQGMGPGFGGFGGHWHGDLTRAAFDEKVRERFARFDANSDGVIDVAEIEGALAKGTKERRGFRHRRADRDGAGQPGDVGPGRSTTKSEFLDDVRRRFALADLDGDGKITDADLPPFMRGRGVLTGERGFGRGGPSDRMMAFLRGANADKDGAITLDEVIKASGDRFDRMDRNKDGKLDRADRDAFAKEMTDYRVKRILHRFGATAEGKITRDQAFKVAGEMFTRFDRNGDGVINRNERPHWGRDGGRHGGGHERGMWRGKDRDRGDEPAPRGEQKKI